MKTPIAQKPTKPLISLILSLFSMAIALKAEPEPYAPRILTSWGEPTNGIRLGAYVYRRVGWRAKGQVDVKCQLWAQRMITNKTVVLVLRFPPVESRYNMKLLGPDGREVELIKQNLASAAPSSRMPVPLNTDEAEEIGSFHLTDLFKIRTNGVHTLIVSERVSTNNTPREIFGDNLRYFSLPPVTNTFEILK